MAGTSPAMTESRFIFNQPQDGGDIQSSDIRNLKFRHGRAAISHRIAPLTEVAFDPPIDARGLDGFTALVPARGRTISRFEMPGFMPGIHVFFPEPSQRRGWPGQARS
jgi:hypothetical protein